MPTPLPALTFCCANCSYWKAPTGPLPNENPLYDTLNTIAAQARELRGNPYDGHEWARVYFRANRALNLIEQPHGACRGWLTYSQVPSDEPRSHGYISVGETFPHATDFVLHTPAGFFCGNWRDRSLTGKENVISQAPGMLNGLTD